MGKGMTNKIVTKAMIMSAGVGSRLEPLTYAVPKPLIPIANKPVMDILLEKLRELGIKNVICNTYYLAEKIIERYQYNQLGIHFNYIKEDTLSGTAGGFVVVVTDENGFIKEFQEKPTVEDAKSNYINTGIYIFNYEIFDFIPENTFYDFAKNVFPELLKKRKINTFEINEYWTDIGTLAQYKQSTKDLFFGLCRFKHTPIINSASGKYINNGSEIPACTVFEGTSTIGSGCKIGKNVKIIDSIIWDDVILEDNITVKNSIIASKSHIASDICDEVIGSNEIIQKIKA